MDLVRAKLHNDLPELSTYFQSGSLVDAVVNLGLPAPIDIQVQGSNMKEAYATAQRSRQANTRTQRRERCVDSAGSGLSRPRGQCESRDGGQTGTQFK